MQNAKYLVTASANDLPENAEAGLARAVEAAEAKALATLQVSQDNSEVLNSHAVLTSKNGWREDGRNRRIEEIRERLTDGIDWN